MPNKSIQPSKFTGSTKSFLWDFLSDLAVSETLSTATVTISVYSGTDASPGSMISGAASISGSQVSQKLTGGVLGVIYEALCTVTTSLGQTLEQSSFIAVVPDLP